MKGYLDTSMGNFEIRNYPLMNEPRIISSKIVSRSVKKIKIFVWIFKPNLHLKISAGKALIDKFWVVAYF